MQGFPTWGGGGACNQRALVRPLRSAHCGSYSRAQLSFSITLFSWAGIRLWAIMFTFFTIFRLTRCIRGASFHALRGGWAPDGVTKRLRCHASHAACCRVTESGRWTYSPDLVKVRAFDRRSTGPTPVTESGTNALPGIGHRDVHQALAWPSRLSQISQHVWLTVV
jgi:hypothetical protein